MGDAIIGARLALRRLLWSLNAVALGTGWIFLTVFVLSGLSIEIAGWLLGDFFTHLANATTEARGAFLGAIAVPLLGIFGVAAWSRRGAWPTDRASEEE